jgi:hypothetical protein
MWFGGVMLRLFDMASVISHPMAMFGFSSFTELSSRWIV